MLAACNTKPRLGARTAAGALLCALSSACGAAEVTVLVRSQLGAAELASIVEYEVAVTSGGAELARVTRDRGADVSLPELEWGVDAELRLTGLSSFEAEVASGIAHPRFPESPADCCFSVCLCTGDEHRAGTCTCGRDECREACPR